MIRRWTTDYAWNRCKVSNILRWRSKFVQLDPLKPRRSDLMVSPGIMSRKSTVDIRVEDRCEMSCIRLLQVM